MAGRVPGRVEILMSEGERLWDELEHGLYPAQESSSKSIPLDVPSMRESSNQEAGQVAVTLLLISRPSILVRSSPRRTFKSRLEKRQSLLLVILEKG